MRYNPLIDSLARDCYVNTGSIHTDYFDYIKFAEKIIKECCTIISDECMNNDAVRHLQRRFELTTDKKAKVYIDPPSGWKYGFPLIYCADVDGDMSDWLLSKGYPKKDLNFALKYLRMWEVPEVQENE